MGCIQNCFGWGSFFLWGRNDFFVTKLEEGASARAPIDRSFLHDFDRLVCWKIAENSTQSLHWRTGKWSFPATSRVKSIECSEEKLLRDLVFQLRPKWEGQVFWRNRGFSLQTSPHELKITQSSVVVHRRWWQLRMAWDFCWNSNLKAFLLKLKLLISNSVSCFPKF